MDNQTIVNIGLQLVDACWNTYASTAYDVLYFLLSDPRSDNLSFWLIVPALA